MKSFVNLAVAAVVVGSMASCNEELEVIAENSKDAEARELLEAKMDEYTRNFVSQYGEPDPTHSWGFRNLPAISFSQSLTRNGGAGNGDGSGAGVVDVNRNQWIELDNNGYKETALARAVQVPGWPNFDGHYYTTPSSGQELQSIEATQPTDAGRYQPAGDVTEYEIQYVSNWFRTNRNPKSIELHLSDFFIQNVSCDHDQFSYPDGDNITESRDAAGNPSASNIIPKVDGTENLNFALDYLCFKPIGASDEVDDTWTHVNNFNSGNSNQNPEQNADNNPYRETKYIYSSGTENFACAPSFGTSLSTDYIYSWVLVKLEWDEVGADHQSHHRTGYYLAFDYQSEKDETKIVCDGYYSNWIVKITPAYFQEESPIVTRVMCEDLGNTFDFDFNDVVFDVAFHRTSGSWDGDPNAVFDAIINIQAAGGTMPIYVAKAPFSEANLPYEAHALLGYESSKPVNVNAGAQHEIATYRIEDIGINNADAVHIYVDNGGTIIDVTGKRANLGEYTGKERGTSYAPEKFAVPTTVSWMNEMKFIEDGYKYFPDWVSQESWSKDGKQWYEFAAESKVLIHQ